MHSAGELGGQCASSGRHCWGSLGDLHKRAEIRTVATIRLSQFTMELSAKGDIDNFSHRTTIICHLVKAGSRTHFQV